MNPAPPVTRKRARPRSSPSPIPAVPVIGNVVLVRVAADLVRLLVIVGLRGTVHEHRGLGSDPLHPVPHHGGDGDEDRILLAHEELVHRPLRRGALPVVVEHHLHHPLHDHEVVGLELVVVPPLHHARVRHGDIGLPELLEEGVVAAHHLHEIAPLVGDDLERLHVHALDQLHSGLPTQVYSNPRRRTTAGSYTFRRSTIARRRITRRTRVRSSRRNSFHSVTSTSASAPFAASYALVANSTASGIPSAPRRTTGSNTRTRTPRR